MFDDAPNGKFSVVVRLSCQDKRASEPAFVPSGIYVRDYQNDENVNLTRARTKINASSWHVLPTAMPTANVTILSWTQSGKVTASVIGSLKITEACARTVLRSSLWRHQATRTCVSDADQLPLGAWYQHIYRLS